MNLNNYVDLKQEIIRDYLIQKDPNVIAAYSMVSVCTHIPVIVCAFYVGEYLNWPPEVLKNIEVLIYEYNYSDFKGIPDSYPGRRI